jgi:hypothetical protein
MKAYASVIGAGKTHAVGLNAGAKVDHDMIILKRQGRQASSQAGHFFGRQFSKCARAGAARQNIKAAMARAAINRRHGILELDPASNNGGKIGLWRDAQLNVDIGQAKVAIDQQHAAARLGQRRGQRNGYECLAHTALATGNRDDGSRRNPRRRANGGTVLGSANGKAHGIMQLL